MVATAAASHAAVVARAEQLGLPTDPAQLRPAAADIEHGVAAGAARQVWDRRQSDLVADCDDARVALAEALDARQASPEPDPTARYENYERECARNAELAAAAGRAETLQRQLDTRIEAERAAEQAEALRAQALARLRAAAAAVEVSDHDSADAPALAEALTAWQRQRVSDLSENEAAQRDWAQFGALLDGKKLTDLEQEALKLTTARATMQLDLDAALAARAVAVQARTDQLAALGTEPSESSTTDAAVSASAADWLADAKTELAEVRAAATKAVATKADADGTLRERARTLPSVAEAEERLEAANTELDRALELDATLTATHDFLEAAQQRVHRDIAPILAATLTEWLPRITGGRYVEAAIDPRTLQVKVCGPARNWRPADRLSKGTAEQVYLLLRVALARRLTTDGVSCPLLLDDVTVQADSKRTAAILDLLHELSADQQIIVFGQEQQVADWARSTLTGPQDAVLEMTTVLGT